MSSLSASDCALFCKYFQSFSGVILDFTSKRKYCAFIWKSCQVAVNPYEGEYAHLSMANILDNIISGENDAKACALLQQMMKHAENLYPSPAPAEMDLLRERCKTALQRLQEQIANIELPVSTNINSHILNEEIDKAVRQAKPTRALDRMHTLATIVLRQACTSHSIPFDKDTPLHSLCGMLGKFYANVGTFQSDFPATVIKSATSIFEKLNYVRNNRSLAHDNTLLNPHESNFVIRIVSDLLVFIQKTEESITGTVSD